MQNTVAVQRQLKQAVSQNKIISKTGIQERLFARAFTNLVYPQIWEDPIVDMQALNIEPHHNLVCIASGGCNVMSYLTKDPASITALDLSPAHIALNKLKLAAAQHTPDYRTFYNFFGAANQKGNVATYEYYFKPHLDEATQKYWDSRLGVNKRKIDMFATGFYQYGLLGKFIKTVHFLAKIHGVDLTEFTTCRTLDEQQRFFEAQIEPIFKSALVKFIVNNRLSLFGLGIPPQQYTQLAGEEGDMLSVLRERTRALMCDFPIQENYFAWQAFGRGYQPDAAGAVPPYLEIENLSKVRTAAARVDVRNQTFTDYLSKTQEDCKHGFVLLDAQDWMSDKQLTDLWWQMSRTAAPKARVIFRTSGEPTILPGSVPENILRDWTYLEEESQKLHKQDRSAIYGGFHIYEYKGA